MKKIIHIDMDAFYASVETRDNPQWKGKPIVVGGKPNSRSVVCAASYEARKFGIRSAMPCSQALRLCPEAIFVEPNFGNYKQVSSNIMQIFRRYTELVEPLSLDEAYLDVTESSGLYAREIAVEIKAKVKEETRLTCSAGVSYNKFLAKMASEFKKPDGLFVIPPENAKSFLENLPLEKFYGIGKKTAQRMADLGWEKGKDLREIPKAELIQRFGKSGELYFLLARGEDPRPVEPHREPKSIGVETTFSFDTDDFFVMQKELNELIEELARRMKKKGKEARTLTLKAKRFDFHSFTRSQTIAKPFSREEEIAELAQNLFQNFIEEMEGEKFRLLGLQASHFLEEDLDKEPSLFLN